MSGATARSCPRFVAAGALALAVACVLDTRQHALPIPDTRPAKGELRVSLFAADCAAETVHTTRFVNGPAYDGMQDNDIRGFLDGSYLNRWNQAGQMHVRVGRKETYAPSGEHELFRVLQVWDGLWLPSGAEVVEARLAAAIEWGPEEPVDLMLYPVLRAWNPGAGGRAQNNVSAPLPGEVWWREAKSGESPWGLPGAGYAREDHPGADTPALILATAHYEPGDAQIVFSGAELARYLTRQVAAGEPARFLIKLADHHEDTVGSRLALYAAEWSDGLRWQERPRLEVRWRGCADRPPLEQRVQLEAGRRWTLPPLPGAGVRGVAVNFESDADGAPPRVELRDPVDGQWHLLAAPTALSPRSRVELRLVAAFHPIALGETFEASVPDTEALPLRVDPPVRARFRDPTGAILDVEAEYEEDHRWTVRLPARVPGRWSYVWMHELLGEPFVSESRSFDVVVTDLPPVLDELTALRQEISASPLERRQRMHRYEERFLRLQRAALSLQTPASYESDSGRDLRSTLASLRAALRGEPRS